MQTSMLYTVGRALTRAHDEGHVVDVLVGGVWLSGRIVGSDTAGVVLEDGQDHCIVRLEGIIAVRVRRGELVEDSADDAMPMPPPGTNRSGAHTARVVDVA
ncbi:hypothetical protein ABIE44_002323 [Marmoricola sp. OAE513]|uniref:hypothetical protein n=1 Tax=Marmoricola sp. OAE513 TaxID=2817894 RepID=UPI001AE91CBB